MNQDAEKKLEQVMESLRRIKAYDIESLARFEDLGKEMNFSEIVPTARMLVRLYELIPDDALVYFPPSLITTLQSSVTADLEALDQFQTFSIKQGNAVNVRQSYINGLGSRYQSTFAALTPIWAFGFNLTSDVRQLEIDARNAMESIKRDTAETVRALNEMKQEANDAVDRIRAAALEQGVSQQAIYFNKEAATNDAEASKWLQRVALSAIGVGMYAILTLFLHKIEYLQPASTYDTIQLAISKFLIFGVLTYVLYLCTRNYLTHRHNAVVNRHREDALKTFEALVSASGDPKCRDIVLTHAAACIFCPQPTGFSSPTGSAGPEARSVVELLTKSSSGE